MSTTVETTKELTEQTEQVAQKQNKKQTKKKLGRRPHVTVAKIRAGVGTEKKTVRKTR